MDTDGLRHGREPLSFAATCRVNTPATAIPSLSVIREIRGSNCCFRLNRRQQWRLAVEYHGSGQSKGSRPEKQQLEGLGGRVVWLDGVCGRQASGRRGHEPAGDVLPGGR